MTILSTDSVSPRNQEPHQTDTYPLGRITSTGATPVGKVNALSAAMLRPVLAKATKSPPVIIYPVLYMYTLFKRIYFRFTILHSKTIYIYKTTEDLNGSLRLIEFISSTGILVVIVLNGI